MREYVNPTGYPIVGTTFHLSFEQMKFLPLLKNKYNLILKIARDLHNHYDKNAINVYASYTSSPQPDSQRQNIMMGYLAKETAQQIAEQHLLIDPMKSYQLEINPELFVDENTLAMKGPSDNWFKIGSVINEHSFSQEPEPQSDQSLNNSTTYGKIINNPFQ